MSLDLRSSSIRNFATLIFCLFLEERVNTVNFVETRFARGTCLERAWDAQRGRKTSWLYVVVQFYPWFKFNFPLFQTHDHT